MNDSNNKFPELVFPVYEDMVDLPSGGKFYNKDHPLYGQTSIEIGQIRGPEEDILSNKDYLRRDIAIDKLLHSLIKSEALKQPTAYNQLLIADQLMLVNQARMTAYTFDYNCSLRCPSCRDTSEFKFDLRKHEIGFPDLKDDKEVVYDEDTNQFVISIPDTKIVLRVVPYTVGTQRKIKNKLLAKKDKTLTNREKYEDIIVSINDETDRKYIAEFFNIIPGFYLKWFEAVLEDINISVSFKQLFVCSSCHHEEELEPPFTADFLYTPKIHRKKSQE